MKKLKTCFLVNPAKQVEWQNPDYSYKPVSAEEIDEIGELNVSKNDPRIQIKMFHINIRSIFKNWDHLNICLQQIKSDFDVIVLTETFYVHDINMLNKEGYTLVYSEGTLNRNDCVIVYTKIELQMDHKVINTSKMKATELNQGRRNENWGSQLFIDPKCKYLAIQ
ncbi:hypothetical protein WA026_004872 [Henosepilachna vigintioctopunctata]|uniref:Uncharacterized protein n=1 Tax=Henosepilachna vigintioctopunctata TaxID=420089 RepID=A0AAW1UK82_9CUCU